MDNNQKNTSVLNEENVLAGAVGAFLFSLVGGVLWFVLYQFGYLASLSGLIGVVCAIKGYSVFAKAKQDSKKGIVISTIITFIVLIIAWYMCISYDIYNLYKDAFASGETNFTLSFFEAVRITPYMLAENPDAIVAYLADLGIGLLFGALGVIYFLAIIERKKKAAAAQNEVSEEEVPDEFANVQRELTVTRKRSLSGAALDMTCYVNGKEVCKLKNGASATITVPGSAFELSAKSSNGVITGAEKIAGGDQALNYLITIKYGAAANTYIIAPVVEEPEEEEEA